MSRLKSDPQSGDRLACQGFLRNRTNTCCRFYPCLTSAIAALDHVSISPKRNKIRESGVDVVFRIVCIAEFSALTYRDSEAQASGATSVSVVGYLASKAAAAQWLLFPKDDNLRDIMISMALYIRWQRSP